MATYVGPDASLERLEQMATVLAGLIADAENRVRQAIAERVAPDLTLSLDDLAALRSEATRITVALQQATSAQVSVIISAAAAAGQAEALRTLSRITGLSDITAATARAPMAPAVSAIAAEVTSGLQDVTRRIIRLPDDVYQRAVIQPVSAFVQGLTPGGVQRASEEMWQRLIAQGVDGFTDKAGRRWSASTYAEMSTRTATRRAYEAQQLTSYAQAGVTLCTIIIGWNACSRCAPWSGKVLRIDEGPTGPQLVPSMTGEGEVEVRIEGTLQQARDQGWGHPNDQCRITGYMPGISDAAPLTTFNAEAYAETQRLRAMERQVRAAKVREASAVTDEQRAAARKDIRAGQAKIRDHVETTGVARQRHREQINLGYRDKRV